MLPRDTGAADFAINSGAPQAELPGDHGRRQTCFHQLKRGGDLLWIEGAAPGALAASPGGGDPVFGPLGDQAPLEMRDRSEDMKNQPATEFVSILSSRLSRAMPRSLSMATALSSLGFRHQERLHPGLGLCGYPNVNPSQFLATVV